MGRFKEMGLALLALVMTLAPARAKLADLLTDAVRPMFAGLRNPETAVLDVAVVEAVLAGAAAVLRNAETPAWAGVGDYDAAAIGRMATNLAGLSMDVVGHHFPGAENDEVRGHVAALLGDVAERVMS
jgi:hypothetical protein